MTSLRLQQPDTARVKPIDWSMLVSVDEAAKMLGKTAGHLRRQCQQLAERGLAYHRPGPNGGQPRWWIDRRTDLALAPGRAGESHRPVDRHLYTAAQNRQADLRIACVMKLRHARVHWPGAQKDWISKLLKECSADYGKKVSRTSLLRWDAAYKGPGSRGELIDKRGGDQKSSGDPEAWDYFKHLFLEDRGPSVRDCWRRTKLYAAQRDMRWCGLQSCYAQLDKRIPPEMQLFHRDPKRWKQQVEAGIDQDPDAWGAGEMWVGDHAQLDFFVRVPGKSGFHRPWITTWLDWRTRKIVGYHVGILPNSTAILFAFRNAMLDESNRGGPGHVSIDNGKDYDCWMFHGQTKQERRAVDDATAQLRQDPVVFAGIYGELDITAHFSIPYSPNGKSRMERWFLTLHEQFDKSFETYAGRNAQAKPEMLTRIKTNPAMVPTLDEAKAELDKWIAAYNKRAAHDIADLIDDYGRKLSPNAAMTTWREKVRVFNRQALDLFLMGWHKPVSVTRRGISISPYGRPLYYGRHEPALMPYKAVPGKKAKKVLVSYDPNDDSVVRVFTTRREFICEAQLDRQGGGANHEQHRAGQRNKTKYRKYLKFISENRHLEYASPAEATLANEPTEPPPTQPTAAAEEMKIVRTPIDDEVAAITRERERMAMAAGAEHQHDDEDDGLTLNLSPDNEDGDSNGQQWDDDENLPDVFSLADPTDDELPEVHLPEADLAGDVPGGPDDDTDVSFNLVDDFDQDDDEPDDGPSLLEMLR